MSPDDEPLDPETLARYERRAPGWQVRCLRCGFREHWGKYGIRKWAIGRNYTLARCRRCGRFCCHAIEKRKSNDDASSESASG